MSTAERCGTKFGVISIQSVDFSWNSSVKGVTDIIISSFDDNLVRVSSIDSILDWIGRLLDYSFDSNAALFRS
jgi:hypothetical protein